MTRLLVSLAMLAGMSWLWGQPKEKLHCSNKGGNEANGEEPARSSNEGWHPNEEKHRSYERRYWLSSMVLTFVVAIGAGASALYAYKAATEAHEQAVQARRQADIAQGALVASTRARLKITITDASVTRSKNSAVAWFKFQPHYKNFGLAPAQGIFFDPQIFVVGTGRSPSCKEDTWLAGQGMSAEVVFPQDEGGELWVGAQVSLDELKAEAAEIHAIQPSSTIYLGVVGCLFYQSSGGTSTYVTGLSGDLHPADADPDPRKYISVYDVITRDDGPVDLKMKVKTLRAWAN